MVDVEYVLSNGSQIMGYFHDEDSAVERAKKIIMEQGYTYIAIEKIEFIKTIRKEDLL